jgi:predicted nucleotidyltransferase
MNRLVEERREQIAAICREPRVRRLALFGFRPRDDFDASCSDLDFVVEFEPLAPGAYANTYFGLIDALERLFGRRVDLVEAGSARNPYFLQEN